MTVDRYGSVRISTIKRAITRFDNAARAYAFMGAQDPADHENIEARYKKARENLERAITAALDIQRQVGS